MNVELKTPKSIHVVGIGGAGMSAIATVLLQMGHRVSGSDAAETAVVKRLISDGAVVSIGHDASNLPEQLDLLTHSTAVDSTNPELTAATQRDVPVLRRSEMLQSMASLKKTIAVAGTHGKTTTSTLLAHVMEAGNTDPSWIIGGEIVGKVGGAAWGSGDFFVVEADESDGTFVELDSYGVIVTNVEPDHLEFYGSISDKSGAFENLKITFVKFVENAEGPKVICLDDPGAADLADRPGAVTYGTDSNAGYCIADVELDRFSSRFTVVHGDRKQRVEIAIPGIHNVRNATAAFAMGAELGVSFEDCATGLAAFQGVGRRFSLRGERNGVTFVDEYAHLPGEVKAALAAARAGKWQRIVAVFQPHRYSRTEQVGHEFGDAFDSADVLVLADVYGAGEPKRDGIDGTVIARAVESHTGHPPIIYVEARKDLAQRVSEILITGDLCIGLGAGDITKLADEIMDLQV